MLLQPEDKSDNLTMKERLGGKIGSAVSKALTIPGWEDKIFYMNREIKGPTKESIIILHVRVIISSHQFLGQRLPNRTKI